jgi:hypothetical protein
MVISKVLAQVATDTIALPAGTTGNITSFASNFFKGISPVVILLIGLLLGLWVIEFLIGLAGSLLEQRAERKEFLKFKDILEARGYKIQELSKKETDLELLEALKYFKKRGYKIVPPKEKPLKEQTIDK